MFRGKTLLKGEDQFIAWNLIIFNETVPYFKSSVVDSLTAGIKIMYGVSLWPAILKVAVSKTRAPNFLLSFFSYIYMYCANFLEEEKQN